MATFEALKSKFMTVKFLQYVEDFYVFRPQTWPF